MAPSYYYKLQCAYSRLTLLNVFGNSELILPVKIENAWLRWIDSNLPFSRRYKDIYYSSENELAESQHVFITGNKLITQWGETADRDSSFTIAEIGFGAGLNFLQTCQLFQETQYKPDRLHYIGFEKYPLSKGDLARVHSRWPSLAKLSEEFRFLYSDHSKGCHRLHLDNGILLDLHFGDTLTQLANLPSHGLIDAWYLDGFAPRLNPEMWQPQLFQEIANHSKSGATLASYSVAGNVRRNLQAAKFVVEKRPGHARKRNMLFSSKKSLQSSASKAESNPPTSARKSIGCSTNNSYSRSALIIGAGLAGCSMARSLSRRNWQIKLVDQASRAAAGASGNAQLALRCRLFQSESELARFYLQSFLYTRRQLHQLTKHSNLNFHNCGVLQLVGAMNKRKDLDPRRLQQLYDKQVMQILDIKAASKLANSQLTEAAYYFPLGGWLDGSLLCNLYLEHPSIELITNQNITSLKQDDNQWQLLDKDGQEIARAPIVVIANGYKASEFEQTSQLPLQSITGQSTIIDATAESLSLATVVCGIRTVFPAKDNQHNLSASYRRGAVNRTVKAEDDKQNLEGAQACFEGDYLSQAIQSGKISVRCNAQDNYPVVGKVPNVAAVRDHLLSRTRFRETKNVSNHCYLSGLYISAAHGSNGLATCPLSSEYLASMIDHEMSPFSYQLMNTLDPMRFVLREMKQKR